MIISVFFVFFCDYVVTQIRRYADTQIGGVPAFSPLIMPPLSKIVFLLSTMSTKIDFCGATGHDHGGWQVAAADGDGTTMTITTTMAATVTTTVGRGVAVAV
jgi:hypothetical protein